MEFKQKAVIHNRFDVEVRDAKTNELKQTAVAYNIILNRWFHYFTNTGGVSYYADPLKAIGFGKGTGTLSETRTDVFSYVGRKVPTTIETVYVSFEICEDGLTDAAYFNAVYKEATELCAYLCKEYKLDPMADGVIIGHYEGHKRGIASNHADPGHWFPKHGKSMDTFRAEVKKLLSVTEVTTTIDPKKLYRVQVGAYSVKANADAMLKKVKAAGFKDAFIKYS